MIHLAYSVKNKILSTRIVYHIVTRPALYKGLQPESTHMVTTDVHLNLIGTYDNDKGRGRLHSIGKDNSNGGKKSQEIYQIDHNFIGAKKWESISHVDSDATRKFLE